MTNTIAIVGGGISGTLTVLQIIKQSKSPIAILWFDAQNKFAKGYAYNTFDDYHLLNVRANNMSVFPDEPNHFINWLQTKDANYSAKDFISRKLFGEYVLSTLESLKHSNSNVTIQQITEEVIAINKDADAFKIKTHHTYAAQKVVLALGNFLPAHPRSISSEFILSKNYFQNAINVQLMQQVQSHQNITIIGSGLTMIDIIVSLARFDYKGKIQVISPHAYIPQAHQENPLPSAEAFIDDNKNYSLLEIVALVNQQIKLAKANHLNLHSVIDAMRPHLQRLWLNFTLTEKQQFLRHLRHKWGVARHRAPSQSMAVFNALKASQQLTLTKGRIFDIKTLGSQFEVYYNTAQKTNQVIHTKLIINCTGPESDYSKIPSTLIKQLVSSQLITPDTLKYGINAQKEGCISKNIYTLGPPLKGILWESVAVPEIRVQAKELATKIIFD